MKRATITMRPANFSSVPLISIPTTPTPTRPWPAWYDEAVVSGWSEFRTEELERAEGLAQKALALDPATTRAYRVLTQVNLYRKRYDLALAQVDRALEINPSDANTMPTEACPGVGG